MQTDSTIHDAVRDAYGESARDEASSCCPPACCAPAVAEEASPVQRHALQLGYTEAQLDLIPEGANLGLGCGNPTAIAGLAEGETVLDLGSGAGMDAFAAAAQVGPTGRVIGVDTTPDMLARARRLAVEHGFAGRVEFRDGLIEELPVTADSVDVILSNCVINLSPDKPRVFAEAFRVLKPGGRLAVSDIVLSEPLPEAVAGAVEVWVGCIAGASLAEDYLGAIEAAGFTEVAWTRTPAASILEGAGMDPTVAEAVRTLGPERLAAVAATVWSYKVTARKPA